MSDHQMVERVRLLLRGNAVDGETAPYSAMSTSGQPALPASPTSPGSISTGSAPVADVVARAAGNTRPDEALQLLTLAQRTADEHIAMARRQAQAARDEAKVLTDQLHREAQLHADEMRAQADKLLGAAHAAAEMTQHEAQVQAAEIRRQAELILADARLEAQRLVAAECDRAEELQLQAEQRYEDAVGGLAVKRAALQKQIEMLETFDADFRRRLMGFLQNQIRALWADRPVVSDIPPAEEQLPGGPVAFPSED